MWQRLGAWVIKNRVVLLIILVISTSIMGYFASQVKLSYEFSKAIPTDNAKYVAYQAFKQKFGELIIAAAPFVVLMLGCLAVVAWQPWIAMALVGH